MKTFSGFMLTSVLGWKINGTFPEIMKSIIIFAPHTSWYDGLIGKLYLLEIGIPHRFLSKKELFRFPVNLLMKWYGSIPVYGNRDFVFGISKLLSEQEEMHIVLSPEGTRKRTSEWKKGFYFLAKRADIPIIMGYLDYSKKEIGIMRIMSSSDDLDDIMNFLSHSYHSSMAKYPDQFVS